MTTKTELRMYTTQDDLRELFDLPANQYGLGIPTHLWSTVNDVLIPADFASYLTEKMVEKGVTYRQLGVNSYSTKGFELCGAVEMSHGVFFQWQAVIVRATTNKANLLYMRSESADNMQRFKIEGKFVKLVDDRNQDNISIDCGIVFFHGRKDRNGVGASEWKRSYVKGELTWVKTMEKIVLYPQDTNLPHMVPDDISALVTWLGSVMNTAVIAQTRRKLTRADIRGNAARVTVPVGALSRNLAMVASDYASAFLELFEDQENLATIYGLAGSARTVIDPRVTRFCDLGRELMEAIEEDHPYLKIEMPEGVTVSHYHNALARQVSEQGHAALRALAQLVYSEDPKTVPTDLEVRAAVSAAAVLMASCINDSRSSAYIANAVKYFERELDALKPKE